VSKKVLATFDSIASFFFNEHNLWTIIKEENPDPQGQKIYKLMYGNVDIVLEPRPCIAPYHTTPHISR